MAETDLITLSRATVQQVLDALEDLAESAEPDCDEENCRDCKSWRPAWAAIAALKAALEQPEQHPARQRFDDTGGREEPDPVERLRFFCSLAMNKQDWLDVEAFFDDVLDQLEQDPDRWGAGYEAGYAAGMAEMKPEQAEPVEIKPPNPEGATQCIVRWWAETPAGWVGAWDREALEQFAHPPRREWRSLSEEDFDRICDNHATLQGAARAIEAALRSKNHE
jgi:hypothetical protein